MDKKLMEAKAKVFKQSVYNKVEELPKKLEKTYRDYENQREEQEKAARLQQQRQSVVFNNEPDYAKQQVINNIQDLGYKNLINSGGRNKLITEGLLKQDKSLIQPATYTDTRKKYGDYYAENYDKYKDMPIYQRDDGVYYLKTKNGYEKVGKLTEEGVVDTTKPTFDKDNLIMDYEKKKAEEKEAVKKAKLLGYKGTSKEPMSREEINDYWNTMYGLQDKYHLTDKEVESLWKENKIPSKLNKNDENLKKVIELGKKLNTQVNDEYENLDIQDRIFLDTFKGTEKQRRQYIDFLTGSSHSVSLPDEDAKWFKNSGGNIFENALATIVNAGQRGLEGIGNFIEQRADLLMTPLTWLEEFGGDKQQVTTNKLGGKTFDNNLIKYEYRGSTYWYDPKKNVLYDENGKNKISRFNLSVMTPVMEYENAIGRFGTAAREQIAENAVDEFFEQNNFNKWIQENTYLGSQTQSGIESMTEMLPLMGGGDSKLINNLEIFASAYSSSKEEGYRMGLSNKDNALRSFINASAETISENFFDNMPTMSVAGWGDSLTGKLAGKLEQVTNNSAVGRFFYNALSYGEEGFEEILSNVLTDIGQDLVGYFDEDYLKRIGYNGSGNILDDIMAEMTSSDTWDAFIVASITSAIMNGMSTKFSQKEQNDLIKSFAEENGLTTKEAKRILKLETKESLKEYQPTGNYEDRQLAEDSARADILYKMATNTIKANVNVSEDGLSVDFYGKEYKLEELDSKIDELIGLAQTIDSPDLKAQLVSAAGRLEYAKQMQLEEQERIEQEKLEREKQEKLEKEKQEQEKLKEEKPKEEKVKEEKQIKVQEEQKNVIKDTQPDQKELEKTIKDNKTKLEKLKTNQSENTTKIKNLEQELDALRQEKVTELNRQKLEQTISKQRAAIEQLRDQIRYEESTYGIGADTRRLNMELVGARNRLDSLLKQKTEAKEYVDNNEKISKIKKEIDERKLKDVSKEIKELEKQIKKDEKTLKNTQEEKIKNTDKKITIKVNEKNIRSWSKTITNSDFEGVDLVKDVGGTIDNEYEVQHNRKTWGDVVENYNEFGYDECFKNFKNKVDSNERLTAYDGAMGIKLIREASKMKKTNDVAYIYAAMSIINTETGQFNQIASIINKLTPEGQLKILQRQVDRLKAKNPEKYGDMKITNEMIEEIENSETEEDLNKNVDAIKKLLAKQVKGTVLDKLRAIRYFSMLARPKTHIRNITSNISMKGLRSVKKLVQKSIEDTVAKIAPNAFEERTISWKTTTQEVKNYVNEYVKNNVNSILKESKYQIESQLQKNEKAFGKTKAGKAFQKLIDLNKNALEKEDFWFKNDAFKNALKEFLTANGIKTVQDIADNQNLFNHGVSYAVNQALESTFQQYNSLAAWLNKTNKNDVASFIVESVLPFKRTPLNIAKTAFEYSPAGLMKTVTKNSIDLKNGKITANQFIDNISKGITGTGMVALGMLLNSLGILRGGSDDKKDKYEKALDIMDYSINIGNVSFSLDWLAPTAIPLFMGVDLKEDLDKNPIIDIQNMSDIGKDLINTFAELSFLDSFSTIFDNYSEQQIRFYDNELGNGEESDGSKTMKKASDGWAGVFENILTNYLSQYVPSIGSDINNIIDRTSRSTYASPDSEMPVLEEFVKKNLSKLVGLSFFLEPYVDRYGNDKKDNVILDIFNSISPGYLKFTKEDGVSDEIFNLYKETKNDEILPKSPSQTYYGVTYNKKTYAPTDKEATQMKKTYGQTMHRSLEKLFKTTTYKKATNEEKAKLIKEVYTYASDEMKKEFFKNRGITYNNKTANIIYKALDEPTYEENAIKKVIDYDIDLTTAKKKK